MNPLTKFNEDQVINVAPIVKNAPPLGSNVFQANATIFELFHQDWTINVASRLLTRENSPPPGGHVFQTTEAFFNSKNTPPPGTHVFQANITIFELIEDTVESYLLTKFHEDWTINSVDAAQHTTDKRRSQKLTMSTLCSLNNLAATQNAQWPGGHIFQATGTIFELIYAEKCPLAAMFFHQPATGNIFETNRLAKFHDDRTINVASREKCPASWQLCFSNKHIIETNLLTKNVNYVLLQPYIIGTNLTKFHEDRKIVVNSVKKKNALPPGGHVFDQPELFLNSKNSTPPWQHFFLSKRL
ncbi:hypothetical protein DPMN_082088 [Dreissena polymorpha]|uniref:Uncharacterized protein n=1 Tax=Dreissena polymorpha TaxID=45954 RepID=A0A9D3Y695_DREPO|nr:hypothetical protein DPMN_082088 [Dreissena polymorpha]